LCGCVVVVLRMVVQLNRCFFVTVTCNGIVGVLQRVVKARGLGAGKSREIATREQDGAVCVVVVAVFVFVFVFVFVVVFALRVHKHAGVWGYRTAIVVVMTEAKRKRPRA